MIEIMFELFKCQYIAYLFSSPNLCFPCDIWTAPSPLKHQSTMQCAKVFLMVTEARSYLPEKFWVGTPKSPRLNEYPYIFRTIDIERLNIRIYSSGEIYHEWISNIFALEKINEYFSEWIYSPKYILISEYSSHTILDNFDPFHNFW